MKRRNGKTYRRVRTQMGHTFWVEMKPEELKERKIFRALVAVTPAAFIAVMAWAAGMI